MFLRFFNVISSSILILFTAAGCTFPGIGGNNPNTAQNQAGVIKIIEQGDKRQIGAVNFLEQKDFETGQTVTEKGLAQVQNGTIFSGANQDEFYLVSSKQGIYQTQNGGQVWRRVYIFPIQSNKATAEERATERQAQLAENNALTVYSFVIDKANPKNIYVSGLLGNVGKLYKSTDGGQTFKEKYSEIADNVAVTKVAVNPINTFEVYAILGGNVLIKSTDGSDTWQKIKTFNDGGEILQISFISEFDNLFFILQKQGGVSTSPDNGQNWSKLTMRRTNNKINEAQPQDALSVEFQNSSAFGTFDYILPVLPTKGQFLLLADRQIWITNDLNRPWSKINLPLQDEQYPVKSIAYDTLVGTDKIYVAIRNKLFTTLNRGDSWSNETIPITNIISQVVVDKSNPRILYLTVGKAN